MSEIVNNPLHIGSIGFHHFSIRSSHFQLYDFFVQLVSFIYVSTIDKMSTVHFFRFLNLS